jgi:transposase
VRPRVGPSCRSVGAPAGPPHRQAANNIQTAVTASGTTLTDVHGVGTLTAAKILAHVGAVGRFRSAAAFANYTGTAPIEVSSGEVVRHRLSRAGDRQLNCCLHVMAITQVREDTPGRAYYLRKRSEGKSHNEAMRCLKRRLSDLVYRRLIHDADRQRQAREDTRGRLYCLARPANTPHTGTSDKSLPGPAHPNYYPA